MADMEKNNFGQSMKNIPLYLFKESLSKLVITKKKKTYILVVSRYLVRACVCVYKIKTI